MQALPICASLCALAQLPNYCENRLTASDAQVQGAFGLAVDVEGDTIVIGAPGSSVAGGIGGAAYVYIRTSTGWSAKEFAGSDTALFDYFGSSVALDGDTLVVGAPGTSSHHGAAYVFVESGGAWVQQQKLLPSVASPGDYFGASVALDGDTLVIGAPLAVPPSIAAAYVFTRSGGVWSEQARLTASDATTYSYFGGAVALDGERALIGAEWFQSFSGRAYLFERAGSTWSEQRIFPAPAPSASYGMSVALDGSTLMIAGSALGVVDAFVFNGTTWTLQQQLHPDVIEDHDFFGSDGIGLVGDRAVISAPARDSVATDSGQTFEFTRNAGVWTQAAALVGSQSTTDDLAGSVAFDGATIVVGVARAGHSGLGDAGEVYAFTLTPGTDTYCTGKLNSLNCTPFMNACGTPSASSSSGFVITCYKVIDATNGLLFYGYSPHNAPFQDGTLCVHPPTRRTPVQLAQNVASSGSCRGAFTLDFNAWIASGADPLLVPGANVYAQWWMRDPASASTTGLSDGVSFTVGP